MANLPTEGDLIARVRLYYKGNVEKPFTVYANGQEVLQAVSDRNTIKQGIQFKIPVSSFDDDHVLTLEFVFPEVDQEELKLDVEDRTYTISFTKIVIK